MKGTVRAEWRNMIWPVKGLTSQKEARLNVNSIPLVIRKLIAASPGFLLDCAAWLYIGIKDEFPDKEFVPLLGLIKFGDIVIEVGGNKGGLAKALSKRAGASGRLISCEPNRVSYAILKQNLKRCGNAAVLHVLWGRSSSPP